MKSYLNAYTLGNEILMLKGNKKGISFLVVEGCTDSLGYYWMVNHQKCFPITAHSKDNVLATINYLEQKNTDGILGIVDADFWNVDGVNLPSNNIVITDSHDIETLIISSPALDKVLIHYGDRDKLPSIDNVINLLLEAGKPLGFLRWLSSKRKMYLNFKGLEFNQFIDEKTLNVDCDKLIIEVIKNTNNCKYKHEDLKKMLEYALQNSTHSPWQICCGHDLIEIFSIGLVELFGSFGSPANKSSVIKWLSLAYESAYFSETALYSAILNWETHNSPYLVLRNDYRYSRVEEVATKIS
ncbi:hypothetical protein J45TS6_16550 [Paenibacillus sp. J45TS6]|uniref:DUF4435 domain-containing protein n=1 Tax=Paenibacillus sp. J45TS6 TaxID=2807196 RepID=UPI001B0F412F|nr:DUF4435 domain-containing protein [Paenibacillus sp. J45TS6]GIP43196.1 hypothetical protein J45TS6_16550 [Paenibacillus sp. J45TS6]